MSDASPLADLGRHIERIGRLPAEPSEALRTLYAPRLPIHVARAPGRLDVMGGIADYSGSLVLQLPIAEAAIAAVQQTPDPGITVISLPQQPSDILRQWTLATDVWRKLFTSDYEAARRMLTVSADDHWAAYVLGPILVLLRETAAQLEGGLRILIDSQVPEGKGVSSSAAVEVATMCAAAAALDQAIPGDQLARLCQLAENRVVGAPCGIMDQMTSSIGREGQLLALRCQPATAEGYVAIPHGLAFWGIDSGIRHAVCGSDYASVRVGAFMGYRIIAEAAGLKCDMVPGETGQRLSIEDPFWDGYLANISPREFRERFANVVPEQISGADFLSRYGATTDSATHVSPQQTYAVRQPTVHPIEENARVTRFRELLAGDICEDSLQAMGELMGETHKSYSACGLGSDGTDLLVQLVRERGHDRGLYGAKITGGGSGGTIAILGRAHAATLVEEIAAEYSKRTGRKTYVFRGSSPGACATDVVQVGIDSSI